MERRAKLGLLDQIRLFLGQIAPCRARAFTLVALVGACGGSVEIPAPARSTPDAGGYQPPVDGGKVVTPPGGAYERCGDPVPCDDGLLVSQFPENDETCTCIPRCESHADRECPAPPPGLGPVICDGTGYCRITCKTFGSVTECQHGRACTADWRGMLCTGDPSGFPPRAHGDGDGLIEPFEDYGACETFSVRHCEPVPTGNGFELRAAEECNCSALCYADDNCPAPPSGYGRPVCLKDSALPNSTGHCALSCQDATGSYPCPEHMACKPAWSREARDGVLVCRGGMYRHGDGDDVIEPGEAYGKDPGKYACDEGLGWTSVGGGWCIDTGCDTDADCPAPPSGYPPPACVVNNCWLSCSKLGSNEECLEGLECVYFGSTSPPNDPTVCAPR